MRNVWFGAVIKHMSTWLEMRLAEDLQKISKVYRVSTNINNLLQCIEREVAKNTNYAKGHSAFFDHYMKVFYPGVYLFPVARALGGTQQDIGVEGAVPVLMNLHYCVEFLDWHLTCAVNDNLLDLLKWLPYSTYCQFFTLLFACQYDGLLVTLKI